MIKLIGITDLKRGGNKTRGNKHYKNKTKKNKKIVGGIAKFSDIIVSDIEREKTLIEGLISAITIIRVPLTSAQIELKQRYTAILNLLTLMINIRKYTHDNTQFSYPNANTFIENYKNYIISGEKHKFFAELEYLYNSTATPDKSKFAHEISQEILAVVDTTWRKISITDPIFGANGKMLDLKMVSGFSQSNLKLVDIKNIYQYITTEINDNLINEQNVGSIFTEFRTTLTLENLKKMSTGFIELTQFNKELGNNMPKTVNDNLLKKATALYNKFDKDINFTASVNTDINILNITNMENSVSLYVKKIACSLNKISLPFKNIFKSDTYESFFCTYKNLFMLVQSNPIPEGGLISVQSKLIITMVYALNYMYQYLQFICNKAVQMNTDIGDIIPKYLIEIIIKYIKPVVDVLVVIFAGLISKILRADKNKYKGFNELNQQALKYDEKLSIIIEYFCKKWDPWYNWYMFNAVSADEPSAINIQISNINISELEGYMQEVQNSEFIADDVKALIPQLVPGAEPIVPLGKGPGTGSISSPAAPITRLTTTPSAPTTTPSARPNTAPSARPNTTLYSRPNTSENTIKNLNDQLQRNAKKQQLYGPVQAPVQQQQQLYGPVQAPVQAPVQQQEQEQGQLQGPMQEPGKGKSKFQEGAATAIAAAVLGLGISSFFFGGGKKTVKNKKRHNMSIKNNKVNNLLRKSIKQLDTRLLTNTRHKIKT
jgi:hypothetical protein